MITAETLLRFFLRFGAVVLLSAYLAVFLPVTWMASAHEWLGMGTFPDAALTGYLTRSISALYAFHGAMMFLASTDVRRYLPMIRLLAIGDLIFGITVLGIDWYAGMPWFWTALEGPSLIVFGGLILLLISRIPTK